ncbi:MAG: zinc-ribbon domain-containing protein [Desulfobacterales bacterium]|nr:zinc-ribbon domain-containing protein [Desulfobacterales bacterium]
MNIVCPTCNASYTIPDHKIPAGKTASATCKKCGKKIAVSSVSKTPPDRPAPAPTPAVAAAAAKVPEASRTGTDAAIFTDYPELQTLSPEKFVLNEIFIQNKKGGYKSRNNKFKLKIIKAVSGILPRMLQDNESVVRIAKGTANYPVEVFLGNGFLTMMYNHYAVICTTARILFINIDHRLKKHTHYLFQGISTWGIAFSASWN